MVEFVQPQHVQAAQQLNGTSLVGSHLSIALATQENIPKIDQSMPVENGLNPTASLGPVPIAPTVLPGSERPPSRFPPLTAEQSDEVSRTVYVGNVNSEVSPMLFWGLVLTVFVDFRLLLKLYKLCSKYAVK